jgi:hypothetical protein
MSGLKSSIRGIGALAIVAAATVGFAVGDALATPGRQAATISSRDDSRSEKDFKSQDDLQWGWNLAAGKTIEIRGVNGWIHVERAKGNRTEVSAEKKWRRSDPDEVKIEVIPTENGVTICAVYPGRWGEKNSCEPNHSHNNVHDNDVQVNFTVRLPSGVRCDANTVNGGIEAEDLDSQAELTTVNGSILASSTRPLSAHTVNGSIRASMGALGRHDLEFQTVNGSVTLTFGGPLDARLHASTLNGDIDSDFPLTIEGRHISRRNIDATIGSGGPELRVATVNGGIRLRRTGSSERSD